MPECSGCYADLTPSRLECPVPICQQCRSVFCKDCSGLLTHDDRLFDRFGTVETIIEIGDYDLPILPEMACDRCYEEPQVFEPETITGRPIRLVPDEHEDQSFLTLLLRPRALQLIQADGRYEAPTERDLAYFHPPIDRTYTSKTGSVKRTFEDGTITWNQKDYPHQPHCLCTEARSHDTWTQGVDDLVHEALVVWIETYQDRHAAWCAAHPDAETSLYWKPYYAHICLKRAQIRLGTEIPRTIEDDPSSVLRSTTKKMLISWDKEGRELSRELPYSYLLVDKDCFLNAGPGFQPEQILLQKEALWEQYALTQDTQTQAEIAYQMQTYWASIGEGDPVGIGGRYQLPPPDYIPGITAA